MAYANGLDLTRTAVVDIPEFSPVTLVAGYKQVTITPDGEAADGFALDAASANRPVRIRINSESDAYTDEALVGGEKLSSDGKGKLRLATANDTVIAKAVGPVKGGKVSVQLKGLN